VIASLFLPQGSIIYDDSHNTQASGAASDGEVTPPHGRHNPPRLGSLPGAPTGGHQSNNSKNALGRVLSIIDDLAGKVGSLI
jgi:hypothetical protein